MSDKVRAIPLIQFMFDEYNLKINDKPTYIFQKFKDSGYDEKPKRKPLEDGTLELTSEELEELTLILNTSCKVKKVFICAMLGKHINVTHEFSGDKVVYNLKAITYLLDRFNLEVSNA